MTKQQAGAIVRELMDSGFSAEDVAGAFYDGEFLKNEKYSQTDAEIVYAVAKEISRLSSIIIAK